DDHNDGRAAEPHDYQKERHPGNGWNGLQDDNGAAQHFAKEIQHRRHQPEPDAGQQGEAVARAQPAQRAHEALVKTRFAQVVQQAQHHRRHARHQEVGQRPGRGLPEQQDESHAKHPREVLAQSCYAGRGSQSLRASCHERSTMAETSYGLPSRVLSEPCACRLSAISCRRAVSLSVSLAVKTCVLMASSMTVSRGSSPRLSVLSVGSAMKYEAIRLAALEGFCCSRSMAAFCASSAFQTSSLRFSSTSPDVITTMHGNGQAWPTS